MAPSGAAAVGPQGRRRRERDLAPEPRDASTAHPTAAKRSGGAPEGLLAVAARGDPVGRAVIERGPEPSRRDGGGQKRGAASAARLGKVRIFPRAQLFSGLLVCLAVEICALFAGGGQKNGKNLLTGCLRCCILPLVAGIVPAWRLPTMSKRIDPAVHAAAVALGSVRSPRKSRASRSNGRLGGRPSSGYLPERAMSPHIALVADQLELSTDQTRTLRAVCREVRRWAVRERVDHALACESLVRHPSLLFVGAITGEARHLSVEQAARILLGSLL